jgi:hypothetical protein
MLKKSIYGFDVFKITLLTRYFFKEYFNGGLECVGHSFAYVNHFVFLRDVWIRTQGAALASSTILTHGYG